MNAQSIDNKPKTFKARNLAFTLGSHFQLLCPSTVMLGMGVMFLMTMFTRKKLPLVQKTPNVRT